MLARSLPLSGRVPKTLAALPRYIAMLSLCDSFDWRQLLLITEPDAQLHLAGKSTCHLMMKTFANFLKAEEILYTPWDTTSEGGLNYTENLKFYLGNKYTSKFDWGRIVLLFEYEAWSEVVGMNGGWLLASTIADYTNLEKITLAYGQILPDSSPEELLLTYVGLDYASK
ncbi:unnamed protein product [Plutella xylostella]|uniref:(diamondback moth) hypothetical protein n=1 Tax=Plutella xylostella TaxID=51655 RepID=A0A8S4FTN3_PLUXY|nr:unnamed protein product [Plutella xylostella]